MKMGRLAEEAVNSTLGEIEFDAARQVLARYEASLGDIARMATDIELWLCPHCT